jgi:hypothetical protein
MEGSTTDYNYKRIECFTWQDVDEANHYLLNESHPFKTIAYDTMTAWEQFIEKRIKAQEKKQRMADFSYGRGSILAREEMDLFLSDLDPLVRKGMNVVLITHSVVKRIQPPELMDGFDKYQLGVDDKSAASLKRWAKAVLFLNFKTHVVETDERKTRAKGSDERIINTGPDPAFDAKVRVDLPAKIPFEEGVWPEELNALFTAEPAQNELFNQFCEIVKDLRPEALKGYLVERGTIKAEDDARAIPEEFLQLVIGNPEGFQFAVTEFGKQLNAKQEVAA